MESHPFIRSSSVDYYVALNSARTKESINMTIALSHGGPTIYASNGKSDELLVGTAKGVTTLRRDGDGWKVAGTVLPEQHISALLLHGDDIYAGAYRDGSLRVSHD